MSQPKGRAVSKYPRMFRLSQRFDGPRVDDVPATVQAELSRLELHQKVTPGQTVAITAGSRGIANIAVIIKAAVEYFQSKAIHDVASKEFDKTFSRCFLLAQQLKVQVHFGGFKPFAIAIPLMEIEDFINNFEDLKFTGQRFALNENDNFVVTYVEIYNPSKRFLLGINSGN